MVLNSDKKMCGRVQYKTMEQNIEREYLESSSGLFLQATSIISGTCHKNKQELERACRIANRESPRKSTKKVHT